MKTLLIMRHAKSAYPPEISDDFDRPLNKRGRTDLPRIARLLAAYGPRPEVVLASAARRAHQTATGLAESLGLPREHPALGRRALPLVPQHLDPSGSRLAGQRADRPHHRPQPRDGRVDQRANGCTRLPADRGSSRSRTGDPLLARNQSRALALLRGAKARKSHNSTIMSG